MSRKWLCSLRSQKSIKRHQLVLRVIVAAHRVRERARAACLGGAAAARQRRVEALLAERLCNGIRCARAQAPTAGLTAVLERHANVGAMQRRSVELAAVVALDVQLLHRHARGIDLRVGGVQQSIVLDLLHDVLLVDDEVEHDCKLILMFLCLISDIL